VLVHAQAVAEDGAAADRAGGVDGDDGDAAPAPGEFAQQGIDEGGLAGARRPGDADDVGVGRERFRTASRSMPEPKVISNHALSYVHYCAFIVFLMQYVAAFDHIMLYIDP